MKNLKKLSAGLAMSCSVCFADGIVKVSSPGNLSTNSQTAAKLFGEVKVTNGVMEGYLASFNTKTNQFQSMGRQEISLYLNASQSTYIGVPMETGVLRQESLYYQDPANSNRSRDIVKNTLIPGNDVYYSDIWKVISKDSYELRIYNLSAINESRLQIYLHAHPDSAVPTNEAVFRNCKVSVPELGNRSVSGRICFRVDLTKIYSKGVIEKIMFSDNDRTVVLSSKTDLSF